MGKASLTVAMALIILTSSAFGFVFGGSNFDFMGYPKFDGYKPTKPFSKDNYSMRTYKLDMESYLDEIKEYTKNGKNDIDRIIESINEANQEAAEAVREYNFFVETGY